VIDQLEVSALAHLSRQRRHLARREWEKAERTAT